MKIPHEKININLVVVKLHSLGQLLLLWRPKCLHVDNFICKSNQRELFLVSQSNEPMRRTEIDILQRSLGSLLNIFSDWYCRLPNDNSCGN